LIRVNSSFSLCEDKEQTIMAKQTPILDKTFLCDTQIVANRVVVSSSVNAGNVMLPAAAGALKFIGVVSDEGADINRFAKLRLAGIAQCVSDGNALIAAGDYVQIGDATGRVRSTAALAFGGATTIGIIGIAINSVAATAGLLVDVVIMPFVHRP